MNIVEDLVTLDKNIDATNIAEMLWLSAIMQEHKSSTKVTNKNTTQNTQNPKHFKPQTKKDTKESNQPYEATHRVVIQKATTKKEQNQTFEHSSNIPTFVATLDNKELPLNIIKYLEEFKIKQNIQSKYIDEDKTAEYLAYTDIVEPIFKTQKQKSPYFNLNLVIDNHDSMFLWQELIDKFKKATINSQIFKQVSLITLDSSKEDTKLYYSVSKRELSLKSSTFTGKDTLTLIISDIIGKAWKSNSVFNDFIKNYTDSSLMAIVSLLPIKFWERTPLRQGSKNLVYTTKRLPTNNDLKAQHHFIEADLQNQEKALGYSFDRVPIITLEGKSLQYLSFFVNAKRDKLLNAYIFGELDKKQITNKKPIEYLTKEEAKELVEIYFASVSKNARDLAIYCSVLPLHPKIVKKVIKLKNLGDTLETFAEFTFGGLLNRSNRESRYSYYDFYPNIRRELMRYINLTEIKSIYKILDSAIKQTLGISKAFLELLSKQNKNDEPISDIEKELIEILLEVLKEKATPLEQENIINLNQKIDTVYLETNSFEMGSNNEYDSEKPVHTVTFDYNFEMAKYPVTFEEYDLFCEDTSKKKPGDKGWGRGRRPVINVSWDDAKEYCDWLNEKLGISKDSPYRYRLPTEAEWEYACRAGTTTKWSFGDKEEELEKYAWYKNSNDKTHLVGEKSPNPWGLYDMHGNVWEWCEDDYIKSYDNTPIDGSAYQSNYADSKKVVRGGSWGYYAYGTRSAYRFLRIRDYRISYVGFRLIRTLPSNEENNSDLIEKDITFNCSKCHTKHSLSCNELEWEITYKHEKEMGAELKHEAYYEIDCDKCNNSMRLTFNCWEYPIGTESFRDVQSEGVEDIKGDCCLDFYEVEKIESIQEAIEEIKEWFFKHYEDPAEHLPYITKEGGYQWIHGEPVDAEEVIYDKFVDEYDENILKQAIDEIGRYEEWSPIPQSEDEFQESLGNWAKKKADEDES